jgi:hypothetical protein
MVWKRLAAMGTSPFNLYHLLTPILPFHPLSPNMELITEKKPISRVDRLVIIDEVRHRGGINKPFIYSNMSSERIWKFISVNRS